MKVKSQSAVMREHNDMKYLITAVIKQSGGWDYFKDDAFYIASNVMNGFSGWIYHNDTVPFAENFTVRKYIIKQLEEDALSLGEELVTMVSNFGYFYDRKNRCSKMDEDDRRELYRYLSCTKCKEVTIPNLMAWYAAETVARWFTDY